MIFLGIQISTNSRKHSQKRCMRLMKCITASKKDQFQKKYMTSTGWGYFRAEINIQFPVCTMWRRLRGLGDLPNGLCHPHSTVQQIKDDEKQKKTRKKRNDLPYGLCHPHLSVQQIRKQTIKLERLLQTVSLHACSRYDFILLNSVAHPDFCKYL